MEQVKAFLGWLKTYHFWVLSLIVLGVAIGAWYTASASLAAQYDANKRKIQSEFQSQNTLRGKPFKPNDVVNDAQRREIQTLASGVEQLWNRLYGVQEENVLIWPSELGGSFAEYMQGKTFGDKIRTDMRDKYLNYIQKRFPELVKIVDAPEMGEGGRRPGGRGGLGGRRLGAEGGGLGGRRGGRGAPEEDSDEPEKTYLVEWLDQETLSSRMELTERPSALEIWVLQEDLWVYETLLKQIADTNKASGATRRNRAPVRTIAELQVGQAAAGAGATEGRLFVPQDTGPALGGGGFGFGGEMGMGRGMGGEFGMSPGMGRGGMEMGMGRGGMGMGMEMGAEGGDVATILLTNRYVDDAGQPIASVPPDYRFGTEFKRLPVRMTLEMDQRWISRLIVELATAPLQVEIEQVRFNPDGVSATGGRRRRGGSGGGEVEAFDREPTVGDVVLHGVIYIFNQPDATILSVGDDTNI